MKNKIKNITNEKKLDKVSIMMISLFVVLVAGAAIALFVMSANSRKEQEKVEMNYTATSEGFNKKAENVTYDNYNDFADAFVEACEENDTDAIIGLYYKDLFDISVENSNLSREKYLEVMQDNMLHIVDYEAFPYGSSELLEMRMPVDYVNELYFRKNGTSFPYGNSDVEDCVYFRTYFDNGAYLDFMFAQIEGFWYVVA